MSKRIKATLVCEYPNEQEWCIDVYEEEDGDYIQNLDYECFKTKEEALNRIKEINDKRSVYVENNS